MCGELEELRGRGVDLGELAALAATDRPALAARLKALGVVGMGKRKKIEQGLSAVAPTAPSAQAECNDQVATAAPAVATSRAPGDWEWTGE